MSGRSDIEWTEFSWNPIRARPIRPDGEIIGLRQLPMLKNSYGYHCEKISPGCKYCYAEAMNVRSNANFGTGLHYTLPNRANVALYLDEKELDAPIYWIKGRRIFPCSMTDIFGAFHPTVVLLTLFRIMLNCPQHTFQILTKRSPRMVEFVHEFCQEHSIDALPEHIWMGVSVEGPEYTKRLEDLSRTQALTRFVSVEPLLEYAEIENFLPNLQWVIVGGESGPAARPFHAEWARGLARQCRRHEVPMFLKQLGSNALFRNRPMGLKHSKGGDPEEWPGEFRDMRIVPKISGTPPLFRV